MYVFNYICNTLASRLISLHCAPTHFWLCLFFCFCFHVPPSTPATPCFAPCRQTFYFVIFLPQAAANATQIKHATFFLHQPCLRIFYFCRLTNCSALAFLLHFGPSRWVGLVVWPFGCWPSGY